MSNSRAAVRYAKAILDLAVDNKSVDAVEADMRSIVSTIAESKELRDVLESPIVNGETKKSALLAVFSGSNTITQGAISNLIANKRISILNEVALKYIILNEQLKGKDIAFVTTAVPLTASLEKKVLEKVTKLTGKEVTLENKVDESILGGFVLRVGDLQYDASIANKLNNLQREFTSSL
ncbi:ATP synthase F1 subcomplex delta subunit [Maribacter vaceletii]|uniref:ATP synthase subunit delta n=1 Tax=Maribacter vaceletii TaxID=1206816 RepID=A0A495ECY9_9FLAO|nr:ATP synthase F1 subunit delta [Maribacter vaceletii]RKR14742.1 ATP synthase F1 subcomplex delta subunit [Maribacter vaceletii]